MDMFNYGSGEWMMGGMWLFSFLFWGMIIIAALLLIRKVIEGNDSSQSDDSSMELLKKRYARGEIDQTTFDRMKHDIEDHIMH